MIMTPTTWNSNFIKTVSLYVFVECEGRSDEGRLIWEKVVWGWDIFISTTSWMMTTIKAVMISVYEST